VRTAPLVTAVIPTYNRADLVCEAIDSVLAQDYPSFEVIVVDDGSTDGTGEMLTRRYGDRIRYIWQENAGVAAARNAGIRAAQGDYIAFQDSDDLWLPGKLTAQMRALQKHAECALCYTKALYCTPDGRPTRRVYSGSNQGRTGDVFDLVLPNTPLIPCPSLVVKRAALAEVGLFDETLRKGEDTDLCLRLTLAYHATYVRTAYVLVRQHAGDRLTHAATDCDIRVYRRLAETLPREREEFRPLVRARIKEHEFMLAGHESPEGDWRGFLERIETIVAEEPDAMRSDFAHQGLVRAMLARGDVGEAQLREVEDLIGQHLPDRERRCRAMFRCAVARKLALYGQHARAAKNGAQAFTLSPVAFGRHFVLNTLWRLAGRTYVGRE